MKNFILFLILVISSNIINGQIIDIPDVNFKAKLLEANSSLNNIAYDLSDNITTIDTNANGEIEQSEAILIGKLFIGNSGISDLTGIEYFTNLTLLGVSFNSLSNINISNLMHLEELSCGNNQLSSINLSGLTNLNRLFCSNNQISILDFTELPNLQRVYCGNNQLSILDFSNNSMFNDLGCKNNPNLTTVKIKNGLEQIFGIQTWLNECWTGNPNLTTICADTNEIPALQAYLAGCSISTSGININSNCNLGNDEFGLNELVVYPNPASGNVNINLPVSRQIANNNIKSIELIDLQGRILQSKIVNENNATFDVSGYSKGVYFVKINSASGSRVEKLVKN